MSKRLQNPTLSVSPTSLLWDHLVQDTTYQTSNILGVFPFFYLVLLLFFMARLLARYSILFQTTSLDKEKQEKEHKEQEFMNKESETIEC